MVWTVVAAVGLFFGSLNPPASAEGPVGERSAERVPLATILATPDRYGGKGVVIRGTVVEMTRAMFPNGRPYYTLLVGDGRTSITVFSWERPSVRQGDVVEVMGNFYTWRYNLRHVIVSQRIRGSGYSRCHHPRDYTEC